MSDPHAPDEPTDASVGGDDDKGGVAPEVESGAVDDENGDADAPAPEGDNEAAPAD